MVFSLFGLARQKHVLVSQIHFLHFVLKAGGCCRLVIDLFGKVNWFKGHTVGELHFEIVWEVPVQDIGKNGLGFLRGVGEEGVAFDHQTILIEVNLDRILHFELVHSVSGCDHHLFLSNEI